MPTFKAVVFKHQKRKTDGKFPVSIQITQNRVHAYYKTGIYIEQKQINRRTFDICDSFVIERMNKTIKEMENSMLRFSTFELEQMSSAQIKASLVSLNKPIDYLYYCKEKVAENPKKWAILASAIAIMENEMNIHSLPVQDLCVFFLEKYKRQLDERETRSGKMKNVTKNNYIMALSMAFNEMKREYNTEYYQVIKHEPFSMLAKYKKTAVRNRSTDVETLRTILNYVADKESRQEVIDAIRISFCLCGMNVADMIDVKSSCYDGERITYERKKTRDRRSDNALISIKVEPEIKDLIEKYKGSEYLFNMFHTRSAETWTHNINSHLSRMCRDMNIKKLTMYWFRHTWATIARNDCDISKDDVDLCLAHVGNNPMADVYAHSNWSVIDVDNRKVLDYVFGKSSSRIA